MCASRLRYETTRQDSSTRLIQKPAIARHLVPLLLVALALAQDPVAGTTREPAFVDLYPDPEQGRVLIGVHALDEPFLLVSALPGGLGSNAVGLDRAQLGEPRLVEFRRVGKRLLLIQRNTRYVARSEDAAERRAAEDAFADSVLWAGALLNADDAFRAPWLVDFTPFLASDAHGIAARLKATGQGEYALDAERSAVLPESSRTFPDNTELEALLTFEGPGESELVRQVAMAPALLTLRQRISLVRLPGPGYRPRRYHPASGAWSVGAIDFAQPLHASLDVRWQPRFRLEKVDPHAAISAVKKPIVFYLDPGTPEPVRAALLDGGNWWADAFESAGFRDAFRVEPLPAGVDPLDVRYNVITWTHRATRGWSYGGSIVDPRSGEIIKGYVTLGSQRVRQDLLIAEALLAPFGKGGDAELREQAKSMALARLRQLAAHEIGHALGFAHNFAASRRGNGSVMDYPHPLVRLGENGEVTLAEAYGVGVGPWDCFLVQHGYGQLAGNEAGELARLRRAIAEEGFDHVGDADAHGLGDAHPDGLLWDYGEDAIATFDTLLEARRRALERFGAGVLPPDRQLGELEARLVPVYLLHRYQSEAVARLLGGARYRYGLAGDAVPGTEVVPAERQNEALARLLAALSASTLALPANVLDALTPPAAEYARSSEYFDTRSGPLFDPMAAVEAATAVVARLLLEPARLNRMAWNHARDRAQPGVPMLMHRLFEATWQERATGDAVPAARAVQSARNWVVLDAAIVALESGHLHPGVAAEVRHGLRRWQEAMARSPGVPALPDRVEAADYLARYLADPGSVKLRPPPPIPPGAPI